MSQTNQSHIRTGIILAVALLFGVVVFSLCGLLYLREADQIGQNLREREVARVGVFSRLFRRDLQSVAADLRVLADGEGLRAFLSSGRPADLDRAVHRALMFNRLRRDYDQIAYLDERGQELMRLNGDGGIAPSDRLQNQAGRPCFQNARRLSPGQIFISAFELNVENGRPDPPFKPVLRFSTPVFDEAGRWRGMYVISYPGANLLARFQQLTLANQHRLRVLNAQGYWLKAAQPAQEWGFMLPGRAGLTMARLEPALWTRIRGETEGQARRAGGLFTWCRLAPREIIAGGPGGAVAGDAFLVIASEVSADEWSALFAGLRQTFLMVSAVLLVMGAAILWLLRERQRAEGILQQSELRLRCMIKSVKDYAVIMLDPDGRVISWNAGAQRIKGYAAEEIIGRHFSRFYPGEAVRGGLPEKMLALAAAEGRSEDEGWRVRKDASQFWANVIISAVPDQNGRLLGFAKVTRDLTEHKRAEQERDRFFTLTRDMLCILGFDGCFKRLNPSWERTFGFTSDELRSKPFIEFVHPDDRERTSAEADSLAAGQETVFFENRHRCKDGSYRWLLWSARPLVQERLIFASARDVTERRLADGEIRKLNADLRHRAVLLEAANKELEAFSYSVSHDLRAPLRHIDGFASMLEKEPVFSENEQARRHLKIISEAARHMGALIDDLLVFSRIGRTDLRRGRVSLDQLVQDARQGLHLETTGRVIRWRIEPLPEVEGDGALLRQVFANLLGNAVKYTRPRAEACIEVGAEPGDPSEVVVFVRDNGAGFDMKYVGKLFGVFQRLHNASEFEGTGVGLANVHRIIQRHGGRTWAEGRVNEGATFYFSLPRPRSAPANGFKSNREENHERNQKHPVGGG